MSTSLCKVTFRVTGREVPALAINVLAVNLRWDRWDVHDRIFMQFVEVESGAVGVARKCNVMVPASLVTWYKDMINRPMGRRCGRMKTIGCYVSMVMYGHTQLATCGIVDG